MADLKRIEEQFPTTEVARDGKPPLQPEGLKLVKGQEPETFGRGAEVSERMPLFSESEMGDFRTQWSKVQTGFVDEPRRAVEDADKLVAAVMQRLAEGAWPRGLALRKHHLSRFESHTLTAITVKSHRDKRRPRCKAINAVSHLVFPLRC